MQKPEDMQNLSDGNTLRLLLLAENGGDTETVERWLARSTYWPRRMFKAVRRYNGGQLLKTLEPLLPFGVLWLKIEFGQFDPPLSTHCYEVSLVLIEWITD